MSKFKVSIVGYEDCGFWLVPVEAGSPKAAARAAFDAFWRKEQRLDGRDYEILVIDDKGRKRTNTGNLRTEYFVDVATKKSPKSGREI